MAVQFDSSTDHYTRTTGGFVPQTTHTIACWLYLSVDRNASWTAVGIRVSGTDYSYLYNAGGDGTTMNYETAANGNYLTLTGANMALNTWYFVACGRGGTGANQTFLRYRTATATTLTETTGTQNFTGAAFTEMMVGNNQFGTANGWLNGRIENLMLWDRALSLDECATVALTKRPATLNSLHEWHPFLVGSNAAEALADYSGNGRTLGAGANSATADGAPNVFAPRRRYYSVPAPAAGSVSIAALRRANQLVGSGYVS